LVRKHRVGETVRVAILRNSLELDISVRLGGLEEPLCKDVLGRGDGTR
jgi:hypothetical protein